MAIKNLAVTIGATVTPFIASGSIRVNWMTFCNNSSHAMAWGGPDTAVGSPGVGQPLPIASTNYQGREYIGQTNLAYWYVAGTQNDVLNVTYDDGADTKQ